MSSTIEAIDLPHFKLSDGQDLVLFLIQKELQGTKFARALNQLGVNSALFDPDLSVAILSLVGFNNRSDELWEWYMNTLDTYAAQVDLQDTSTAYDLAYDFYLEMRTRLNSVG